MSYQMIIKLKSRLSEKSFNLLKRRINGKNFVIKGINGFKFLDNDGNEIKDLRDREPVLQETRLDISIMDLILHHTTIPLDWINKKPFCNYGYYGGSSLYENWYWDEDKLNEAPEVDLWKMYGLCNEYWCHQYEYWDHKHEKEFRDYRRSKGENLDNWNFESISLEDDLSGNVKSAKLRISGDRDEK